MASKRHHLFNGCKYDLNVSLLERYFFEFRYHSPKMTISDSSCWRGHIINFEIKNQSLIIKKINFLSENEDVEEKKFLDRCFPNRKFDWFSGFIRIDNFKGDYDDELNEASQFEFLEIKKGDLVNHWKFNFIEFQEFKSVLFIEFKKLKEYDTIFSDLKETNLKLKHSEIENRIQQSIISLVNESYTKIW